MTRTYALLAVWLGTQSALAAPALTTGTGGGLAASSEDLRLKALEAEVDQLKDKIFKSKARLLLLQETVLHGAAAGAVAKIVFKNEMGGAYRLESANWVLDGQTIFNESATPGTKAATGPSIAERKEIALFDGAIVPGSHNLTVTLVYRGSGYKMFSYLEGYRFTVQSTYAFLVEEGKTTDLEVVAYPKDGLQHAYEDRLDVRFTVSTKDSVPLPMQQPEAKP